jgi:hypothetical protein
VCDGASRATQHIQGFRFNTLAILIVHFPSKIGDLFLELLPESIIFKVIAASIAARVTAVFGWILASGNDSLEGGHEGFFHVGEAEVLGNTGDLGRERFGEVDLLV